MLWLSRNNNNLNNLMMVAVLVTCQRHHNTPGVGNTLGAKTGLAVGFVL